MVPVVNSSDVFTAVITFNYHDKTIVPCRIGPFWRHPFREQASWGTVDMMSYTDKPFNLGDQNRDFSVVVSFAAIIDYHF